MLDTAHLECQHIGDRRGIPMRRREYPEEQSAKEYARFQGHRGSILSVLLHAL